MIRWLFLAFLVLLSICIGIGAFCEGFGLSVKSWPWLIGGYLVAGTLFNIWREARKGGSTRDD